MTKQHSTIIRLFSTSACHLCELAEDLLIQNFPNQAYHIVEIAEDDKLIEQYGHKIPVLCRTDNLTELNWPFTALDIQVFLKS